jgi:hypothetical protein
MSDQNSFIRISQYNVLNAENQVTCHEYQYPNAIAESFEMDGFGLTVGGVGGAREMRIAEGAPTNSSTALPCTNKVIGPLHLIIL